MRLPPYSAQLCSLSFCAESFSRYLLFDPRSALISGLGTLPLLTSADQQHPSPNPHRGDHAVVIPVPTLIERGQINVGDKNMIDPLDAYTSPRLVEYFDGSPCQLALMERRMSRDAAMPASKSSLTRAEALGVTVQAQYTVGEYDIVILSARQGQGLETWLKENGSRLPRGAPEVLGSYIKQKMHFFVAKVNLKEQSKLGFNYLRPIQVAFESPKFTLPLRLGTLNDLNP